MDDSRFRKKFTLTLLIWAAGSFLAYDVNAGLGEYTAFSTLLLGVFGTQDLFDKKLPNY